MPSADRTGELGLVGYGWVIMQPPGFARWGLWENTGIMNEDLHVLQQGVITEIKDHQVLWDKHVIDATF